MHQETIRLSNGNLAYIRLGKGPTILFFHGGIATPGAYEALIRLLSNNFTVIAPTHPGHGNSFSINDDWTISEFISTYKEFLHKLTLAPEILMGHSLGGAFALLLSLHCRSKKIIVFDSAGLPFPGTPASFIRNIFAEAKEAIAKRPDLTYIKNTLPTAGTLVHTAVRHPDDIPGVYTHIPRLNIAADLNKIITPTHMYWGERDLIIPPTVGSEMHRLISGSKLTILSGYGHIYPVTDPEMVIGKIKTIDAS